MQMKNFPFTWPELAFMALVMFLPLLAAFHWCDGSLGSFMTWLLSAGFLGLCSWVAILAVSVWRFDRSQRK